MSIETLKRLRFFIPGIIIFIYWAMLGNFTGDWKVKTSLTPDEIGKTTAAVVLALLYYVLPLRNWANRRNYNAVNSNITKALIEIGKGGNHPEKASWQKVKPLFYRLVNSDDSLTYQSKRAMFNGLLWTSAADIRAISIIFFAIGGLPLCLRFPGSLGWFCCIYSTFCRDVANFKVIDATAQEYRQ